MLYNVYTMAGDNRKLVIENEGRVLFEYGMRIAFGEGEHKARHYAITEKDGLILMWGEDTALKSQPLPYPMTAEVAIPFAWSWLEQADYGQQPDHDGSNGKGWTLHRDGWGHVAGSFYAIVGIKPTWAMYGK